jgi:hypothetical protein
MMTWRTWSPAWRIARSIGTRFRKGRFLGDANGERIFATAIVERFVLRADGEFEPLTEGSTKPIAQTVTDAGIALVFQYDLRMP